MADLHKTIQQRPPDSKFVGLDFTESKIHNLETWKKLELLSEEIYLQHTRQHRENDSYVLNKLAFAVDKLADYIIAGLNTVGDGIIIFGEALHKGAISILKVKNIIKKT
jgi:hypothetical protein